MNLCKNLLLFSWYLFDQRIWLFSHLSDLKALDKNGNELFTDVLYFTYISGCSYITLSYSVAFLVIWHSKPWALIYLFAIVYILYFLNFSH